MKYALTILIFIFCLPVFSQVGKRKVPSYFGFVVRPVFPTKFIGSPIASGSLDGFNTETSQKMGFAFGGTVRVGLTKLVALETGINFTQRNFDITMSYPDSNSYDSNTMKFVEYDIPLNALFYIKLTDQWFMNASMGFAITYKPTDVAVYNTPGGYHTFTHFGVRKNSAGIDANANLGFEFRTEKSGIFYLGGSGRVPFAQLFDISAHYKYQGNITVIEYPVDGSFLALDFKYFFPDIKNKGPQFNNGPIE